MVTETRKLRAAVFQRTGIAIDEQDPIMAVLAVAAEQTEDIGARLLARTSPARVAAVTAVAAFTFALTGGGVGWHIGQRNLEQARSEWMRAQADPRRAALLASAEGRAALRLAELGVAELLANCSGRASWRIRDGYCIPATPQGTPDGFRVREGK
jgi:hypothetical protein